MLIIYINTSIYTNYLKNYESYEKFINILLSVTADDMFDIHYNSN